MGFQPASRPSGDRLVKYVYVHIIILAATLVSLLAARPSRAQPSPAALAPLPAEAQQALAAIPEDPPPPKLIKNTHYLISDEPGPERFREAIADRGGIYVGVGPEQSYFFASWSKAEVAVLVDFDQWVVDLHAAYQAYFRHAPDPEAFLSLWSAKGTAEARAVLDQAISSPQKRAGVEAALVSRRFIHIRLRILQESFRSRKIPSFLTDQSHYDYLRQLLSTGRVVTIRGDLTGAKTMSGLARAAARIGLPIRTLYLSNVEGYFDYSSGLGQNILALPVDSQSLVLRTVLARYPNSVYYYVAQKAQDFNAWLRTGRIARLSDILAATAKQKQQQLWYLPGP